MYKNILVPIDVWEKELTDMVTPHVESLAVSIFLRLYQHSHMVVLKVVCLSRIWKSD